MNGKLERYIFLLLCILAGAIEIGIIVFGIKGNLPVIAIISLGLAYQLGNLFPNPIQLGKHLLGGISILSILLSIAYIVTGAYYLIFFTVILLAIEIQTCRSKGKKEISTTQKRLFRVIGFILSSFLTSNTILAMSIMLFLIVTIFIKTNTAARSSLAKPKIKLVSFIMAAHQIHYFSYTYFLFIIASRVYKYQHSYTIILLFMLGWITYISVAHILRGEHYYRYFFAGHCFLALCLLFILKLHESWTLAIPWVLTGFGGGTVFCIEKIAIEIGNIDKNSLVFSENIGHVLGVLIGLLLYKTTNSQDAPLIVSITSVFLTLALMAVYRYSLKRNKTNNMEEEV
jgi:hypothetical protein